MDTSRSPFESLGFTTSDASGGVGAHTPDIARHDQAPSSFGATGGEDEPEQDTGIDLEFLRQLIAADQDDGDETRPIEFASVRDAVLAVDDPANARLIADIGGERARIAAWVVGNTEGISFSREDWHGLYLSFLRKDQRSALAVAQAGLEFFPFDTTLLGDVLQACSKLACWDAGDRALDDALGIELRFVEDWYLPVWASEYRRSKARASSSENRTALLEAALAYLRAVKQQMPNEDRILNEEAEILIEMNDIVGARKLLDEAIFEPHVNGEGIACHIMAPQCCLTYLQKLLVETDEYDRIIQVAQVGIRASANEDRSVRVGYFLYRMALAKDCKIHAAVEQGTNAYGNRELVRDALQSYALAYSMEIDDTYREKIAERFRILAVLSGVSDVALEQFCAKEPGRQQPRG